MKLSFQTNSSFEYSITITVSMYGGTEVNEHWKFPSSSSYRSSTWSEYVPQIRITSCSHSNLYSYRSFLMLQGSKHCRVFGASAMLLCNRTIQMPMLVMTFLCVENISLLSWPVHFPDLTPNWQGLEYSCQETGLYHQYCCKRRLPVRSMSMKSSINSKPYGHAIRTRVVRLYLQGN